MRFFLGIITLVFGFGTTATADHLKPTANPLRSLETFEDSRGWEGVGLLNIADRYMCTGALIAPDLVLTAAHCLYDKDNNTRINPASITFLAGWRAGRASAYGGVKYAVTHPDYRFSDTPANSRVRDDIALLQLRHPIKKSSVIPFEIGARPRKGADVGVVSYARERSDAPSIEEKCNVLARRSGALILSCIADFGASGAPVFDLSGTEPRIVSVVSAMAEVDGHKVSLGTSLDQQLDLLKAQLLTMNDRFQQVDSARKLMMVGRTTGQSSAKFVRP